VYNNNNRFQQQESLVSFKQRKIKPPPKEKKEEKKEEKKPEKKEEKKEAPKKPPPKPKPKPKKVWQNIYILLNMYSSLCRNHAKDFSARLRTVFKKQLKQWAGQPRRSWTTPWWDNF